MDGAVNHTGFAPLAVSACGHISMTDGASVAVPHLKVQEEAVHASSVQFGTPTSATLELGHALRLEAISHVSSASLTEGRQGKRVRCALRSPRRFGRRLTPFPMPV
jgi:hypothetical protein